jgi:hypothetical protein
MLAVGMIAAEAAGPYDGTWQFQAPAGTAVANITDPAGCEPVKFQVQVKDSKITGSLARDLVGRGRVENSEGKGATPITGKVEPDGAIISQWQDYTATGKLEGSKGSLRWNGPCGLRTATGERIGAASGSSTAPK